MGFPFVLNASRPSLVIFDGDGACGDELRLRAIHNDGGPRHGFQANPLLAIRR